MKSKLLLLSILGLGATACNGPASSSYPEHRPTGVYNYDGNNPTNAGTSVPNYPTNPGAGNNGNIGSGGASGSSGMGN